MGKFHDFHHVRSSYPPIIVVGLFLMFFTVVAVTDVERKEEISSRAAGVESNQVTLTSWRSMLYPENWKPGFSDAQGRSLQDFSYAGYHAGEKAIPTSPSGQIYNVTTAPYNADKTGTSDATLAIQKAIDAAGAAGGGIVYLPAGTYMLKPQGTNNYALRIAKNNILLRGEGATLTKLFLNTAVMRSKSMILVAPAASVSWKTPTSGAVLMTKDLLSPTTSIPVADTTNFAVGDWIILTHDDTLAWKTELGMADAWSSGAETPTYYRRITAINATQKVITIDEPTRFYLKTRDKARIYKVGTHLQEVGIEHIGIGMLENTKSGLGEQDYDIQGTAAYDLASSNAIRIEHTVNAWIQDVKSYQPSVNKIIDSWVGGGYHIQSNGIEVTQSRFVTISNCDFRNSEYRGGDGNGHFYQIEANDVLITHSRGENGRHNFSFKGAVTSGSVMQYTYAGKGWHMSDFHTKLSQGNLIDNHTVAGDAIESRNRYDNGSVGSRHGITNTQSVFWNTKGDKLYSRENLDGMTVDYIIHSDQQGWGYVIGTKGTFTKVYTPVTLQSTAPVDFVEGIGKADTLQPESLYADQLQRRLGATPTVAPVTPTNQPTHVMPITVFLHGIGNGGDNLNPNSSGTVSPLHTQRVALIDFFNAANQLVLSIQTPITFTSGSFQGNSQLGALPAGPYTVKVSVPFYLRRTIPGIIQVIAAQNIASQTVVLIAGDSNKDNALSVLDYNILLDCFSDLSPSRNCADPAKRESADLTDDGNVNQFDYNLFLRELSVQGGA